MDMEENAKYDPALDQNQQDLSILPKMNRNQRRVMMKNTKNKKLHQEFLKAMDGKATSLEFKLPPQMSGVEQLAIEFREEIATNQCTRQLWQENGTNVHEIIKLFKPLVEGFNPEDPSKLDMTVDVNGNHTIEMNLTHRTFFCPELVKSVVAKYRIRATEIGGVVVVRHAILFADGGRLIIYPVHHDSLKDMVEGTYACFYVPNLKTNDMLEPIAWSASRTKLVIE